MHRRNGEPPRERFEGLHRHDSRDPREQARHRRHLRRVHHRWFRRRPRHRRPGRDELPGAAPLRDRAPCVAPRPGRWQLALDVISEPRAQLRDQGAPRAADGPRILLSPQPRPRGQRDPAVQERARRAGAVRPGACADGLGPRHAPRDLPQRLSPRDPRAGSRARSDGAGTRRDARVAPLCHQRHAVRQLRHADAADGPPAGRAHRGGDRADVPVVRCVEAEPAARGPRVGGAAGRARQEPRLRGQVPEQPAGDHGAPQRVAVHHALRRHVGRGGDGGRGAAGGDPAVRGPAGRVPADHGGRVRGRPRAQVTRDGGAAVGGDRGDPEQRDAACADAGGVRQDAGVAAVPRRAAARGADRRGAPGLPARGPADVRAHRPGAARHGGRGHGRRGHAAVGAGVGGGPNPQPRQFDALLGAADVFWPQGAVAGVAPSEAHALPISGFIEVEAGVRPDAHLRCCPTHSAQQWR
mmetsp:Transcript_35122/g.108417  ORF Transcript_35122/g.108417 Transcript_35122/m.108417 type:complete len:468 (+) Transcript_35122:557-1960(+)